MILLLTVFNNCRFITFISHLHDSIFVEKLILLIFDICITLTSIFLWTWAILWFWNWQSFYNCRLMTFAFISILYLFVCWKVYTGHLPNFYNFYIHILLNIRYFIPLLLTVFLQLSFHNFGIYCNTLYLPGSIGVYYSFIILQIYFFQQKLLYDFAIDSLSLLSYLHDSIFVCWKVDIAHFLYLYNFDKYISLKMSYSLTVFLQLSIDDFCIYFNIILICMLENLPNFYNFYIHILLNIRYFIPLLLTVFLQLLFHSCSNICAWL
jgi:hypothetical protein